MATKTAEDFLRDFRDAAAAGLGLEYIARDPAGFDAALYTSPDELGAAFETAAAAAGGTATVDPTEFATAACARDGTIIVADTRFAALRIDEEALARLVASTGTADARLSTIADDASGHPVALAVSASKQSAQWPLTDAVRAALAQLDASFAIIAVRSGTGAAWPRLLRAWGLSTAEARLTGALVRTGNLRAAAAEIGVGYETAREALATAMSKTGARRQAGFVQQLATLAFGELPSHDATWRTFADAYDLTVRQAQLAQLIAFGATRDHAAAKLGISSHTGKSELKLVFDRCGVDSATSLGRAVAEIDALARLAAATEVEIAAPGGPPEPLRFIRRRRASGRIAVEDHGPLDAAPVIILHALTNGRHLPKVLVKAMQRRGLRPISIDRPGFGLTSAAGGDVAAEASDDCIDVLDALGIDRVQLVGRVPCLALALAARYPERISGGVLLTPNPPGTTTRPSGLMGTAIAMSLDSPWLVERFARMMVRLSSPSAILRMTETAVQGCPADLAVLADPASRHDWIRANRQSSRGDGFARELPVHAAPLLVPATTDCKRWTAIYGTLDSLATDMASAEARWRSAMPGVAVVTVQGGGRLLHLSHPDVIAAALASPG